MKNFKTQTAPALLFATFASMLAACGYGGHGSSYTAPMPVPTGSGAGGSTTIGMSDPSGLIGNVNTQFGTIGGFTQSTYSQVLAFAPGTTVTLKNLSPTSSHTLNVLSTSSFPSNPTLSMNASGGNTLAAGYASGVIAPGATKTVTLSTAGTYFIGDAFDYMKNPSMRGVIVVGASATPGPQATPPPSGGGGGISY